MVDELGDILLEYGGCASHAWCFLHTTNLVAKSLICVFEAKKDKKSGETGLEREIEELSIGMEREEQAMVAESKGVNVQDAADNNEGLVDLTRNMNAEERVVHDERVHPVRLLLVKVCIRIVLLLTYLHSNTFFLDPQVGVQDHPFNDYLASCMVGDFD